jgi:uncharacterized membrane protein YedE/YeeE
MNLKTNLTALFCGLLFGIGLSLSHMINPEKVLNFLDVAGNWDPSLLFVMLGALPVAMLSFRAILKRPGPHRRFISPGAQLNWRIHRL